jgi:hypothetical protein
VLQQGLVVTTIIPPVFHLGRAPVCRQLEEIITNLLISKIFPHFILNLSRLIVTKGLMDFQEEGAGP